MITELTADNGGRSDYLLVGTITANVSRSHSAPLTVDSSPEGSAGSAALSCSFMVRDAAVQDALIV